METDSISYKNSSCYDAHSRFADGVKELAKTCGIEGFVLHSFTEDDKSVTHLQVCENVCGQKMIEVVKRSLEVCRDMLESVQDNKEVH